MLTIQSDENTRDIKMLTNGEKWARKQMNERNIWKKKHTDHYGKV